MVPLQKILSRLIGLIHVAFLWFLFWCFYVSLSSTVIQINNTGRSTDFGVPQNLAQFTAAGEV